MRLFVVVSDFPAVFADVVSHLFREDFLFAGPGAIHFIDVDVFNLVLDVAVPILSRLRCACVGGYSNDGFRLTSDFHPLGAALFQPGDLGIRAWNYP